MRWQAVYSDGTSTWGQDWIGSGLIDRSRLVRFKAWPDPTAIVPLLDLDIPSGALFILRRRVLDLATQRSVGVVAIERGELVDVYVVDGYVVHRRHGWGTDVLWRRPELVDSEMKVGA